jgi:hypothetical protein
MGLVQEGWASKGGLTMFDRSGPANPDSLHHMYSILSCPHQQGLNDILGYICILTYLI